MRSPCFPSALAATLAILALGAGSASAAATRAEYVTQVDPICQRAAERQSQVHVRGFARRLGRLNKIERQATEEIALVPAAPGDEAIVGQWVQLHRDYNDLIRRVVRAAKRGNAAKVARLLIRTGETATRFHALVAGFGFRYCG